MSSWSGDVLCTLFLTSQTSILLHKVLYNDFFFFKNSLNIFIGFSVTAEKCTSEMSFFSLSFHGSLVGQ